MNNPYKIEGPAIISVSGGRTSGFMLRQIIDAHGGKLPDDVIPAFCNTGLEHEATYRFLDAMSKRWTPITWLEYQTVEGKHAFRTVDFCGAARNGQPFTQLITKQKMVPNTMTRFCTSELKIRTGNRFAKALGWSKEFTRVVGLRADEPRRVAKMKGDTQNEHVEMPMNRAGHTLADVTAFWNSQGFDLELPGNDNAFGNCQLCFLKGRDKIAKVMRTMPDAAAWWIDQEERQVATEENRKSTFRIDRPTYRQMFTALTVQGQMFDDAIEDETMPCACTD